MARVPTAMRPGAWTPPLARIEGDRLLKARQAEQRVREAQAKVEMEARRVEEMESQKLDEEVKDLRVQLNRLTDDLPKIIPSGGGGKRMVERVFQRDRQRYRDALGIAQYADRSVVAAERVPADIDNILVEAYSSASPSVGRANYRAASDADYTATPALLRLTDAAGRKFVINERVLNPMMAGASGDGTGNDGPALTAMFDYIRANITTQVVATPWMAATHYVIDLLGGSFRTTDSIDATNITALNFALLGGLIIGACTGKPVLDMTNTRNSYLSRFTIYGEAANMPSIGLLTARGTTGAQDCANCHYSNVSINGFFSVAAEFCYGQETSHRDHCRYWNFNRTGRAAIYQSSEAFTPTSDFQTLRTGAQSFINNTFDTCDWRQVPATERFAITAVTKGATTTITCPGHTLVNGDTVTFWAISSMFELNARALTVSNATATTVDVNIDSTTFTTFTSGGFIIHQPTTEAIYWDGGRDHKFVNCYAVGYGPDLIAIGLTDTTFPVFNADFGITTEGAQSRSTYRFIAGTAVRTVTNLSIQTLVTYSRESFISTDASGAGRIYLVGGGINVSGYGGGLTSIPLFTDSAYYRLYGEVSVTYPKRANIDVTSMVICSARVLALDDKKVIFGGRVNGQTTPAVTATSGTITTATSELEITQIDDSTIFVTVRVDITTNGTGAGAVRLSLPSGITATGGDASALFGWEQVLTGDMVVGKLFAGFGAIDIVYYAGAYPGADGARLHLSGTLKVSGLV